MINVSKQVVEKLETRVLCSITFFENPAVCEIMWKKYCRARQATIDNTAQAYCMLDTQGYKYTHIGCVTNCFSTATMVARTRLSVVLKNL